MSTLHSNRHPCGHGTKPVVLDALVGSDDEQSHFKESNTSSKMDEKPSRYRPSSPKLLPVSFDAQPLPHVKRLYLHASYNVVNRESVSSQLKLLNASVSNGYLPPATTFHQMSPPAPKALADFVSNQFSEPSPIQAVSFPYIFMCRDIIAIAQTGSGKTIAYAFPLIAHVAAQSGSSRAGRGPVGLVMVPTRELATQVSQVINRLGEGIGVYSCCVIGGVSKYEQFKQIRDSGAGILVCTPGRLIDMLYMRACQMLRCSFVVVDEADRMLDMGFGAQVRTLLSQIRPDTQRALFSATFPESVRSLVYDILSEPVTISMSGSSIISPGENTHTMVSNNVKEYYFSFSDDNFRCKWMLEQLPRLVKNGLVIVFCSTRGDAALTANIIRKTGIPAVCTHGETEQSDREMLLRMFRAGEVPILVTTDMSARGLDIDDVHSVVNYGCAKSWDWHVHRVGRTGRASQTGNAYTLMDRSSPSDASFAREAVALLNKERRNVPPALTLTANFAKSEYKTDQNQRRNNKRNRLQKYR